MKLFYDYLCPNYTISEQLTVVLVKVLHLFARKEVVVHLKFLVLFDAVIDQLLARKFRCISFP